MLSAINVKFLVLTTTAPDLLYVCFLAMFELHLSCVRSASEETLAVLEEVIMLAFQQCVYYITKVRVR